MEEMIQNLDGKATNTIVLRTNKSVGGYDITGQGGGEDSFILGMPKKPNWFHRAFTRIFLGWVWTDEIENKKEEKQLLFD